MLTQDDQLTEILTLGVAVEKLRQCAYADHGAGAELWFDAILDGLVALDPSPFPEKVRVQLRLMGMEERFDAWVQANGYTVPVHVVAHGGTVRWVIAPVF